jgi:hypothetical protein
MVFRRLADRLRQQDWAAITIEFVLLVLGVFLGLQAQEWAREREARADERILLTSLRAEFVEARDELTRQAAKHRQIEGDVAYVIDALDAAARDGATHAKVLDQRMAWALVATTTQLSQGELKGTLSSGRLPLIRNDELRTALADWDSVLDDATEDEVQARILVADQIEPLLWRVMDARAIRNYQILRAPPADPQRGATSELPVDPELRGALATRRYWLQHIISEFEGPTHEAERIIRLIDATQQASG